MYAAKLLAMVKFLVGLNLTVGLIYSLKLLALQAGWQYCSRLLSLGGLEIVSSTSRVPSLAVSAAVASPVPAPR